MASLKAHPADKVISPYGSKSIIDPPCEGDGCGNSPEAIVPITANKLSAQINGRTLSIAGAKSAKIDVFDMQGRPVFSMKGVKGAVELQGLPKGLYMVRVRDGSASLTKRIVIR